MLSAIWVTFHDGIKWLGLLILQLPYLSKAHVDKHSTCTCKSGNVALA